MRPPDFAVNSHRRLTVKLVRVTCKTSRVAGNRLQEHSLWGWMAGQKQCFWKEKYNASSGLTACKAETKGCCWCVTVCVHVRQTSKKREEKTPDSVLFLSSGPAWWWFSRSVMFDFCDLRDCSPPGYSVQGITHLRILGWVAIPYSKAPS